MDVLVDCDGCLLDDRADVAFREQTIKHGLADALDWYANNCPDNLELNIALYLRLVQYKAEGHRLILWTNRGHRQINTTLMNLSRWGIADMFDMFVFGDGHKTDALKGECIAIDNEWENIEGVNGILIPTFSI